MRVKNPDQLEGCIKLKKDPKSEKFNINNLILKESTLKHTDWVIGFVLFAGQNSFLSSKIQKKFLQFDDIENILNILHLGLFFQIIIFSIVKF